MPDSPWARMLKDIDQVIKARERLNDHQSPVGRIKKPVGMRTAEFETIKARIRKYEARINKAAPKIFKLRDDDGGMQRKD